MNRFDSMYEGSPPWEIGRPQTTVVELWRSGRVSGRILDVGCGTGENALLLAQQSGQVLGVDGAARAIELAREKARTRGVHCRFEVKDALDLGALGERFDSVLDCGLFHVFDDQDRRRYAKSLAAAMRPGASLHLLCFSEHEPDWGGPRRVTQAELLQTFASPFHVESIVPRRFETKISSAGAHAWLATVTHIGTPLARDN